MMANEFVSIVEQEARKANDPTLWVMNAGAELATSPLGLAEGRSILGGAVVDGLLGKADDAANGGNGDHDVSLAELKAFVSQRCASSKVLAPEPTLLCCVDKKNAPDPQAQVILRVPPPSAEAPSEAAGKTLAAAKKAPAAKSQLTSGMLRKEAPSPQKNASAPASLTSSSGQSIETSKASEAPSPPNAAPPAPAAADSIANGEKDVDKGSEPTDATKINPAPVAAASNSTAPASPRPRPNNRLPFRIRRRRSSRLGGCEITLSVGRRRILSLRCL
jgi:hypothetical protein